MSDEFLRRVCQWFVICIGIVPSWWCSESKVLGWARVPDGTFQRFTFVCVVCVLDHFRFGGKSS